MAKELVIVVHPGGAPAPTWAPALTLSATEYAALLASELSRLTETLKALGASKIILYGSYAYGKADPSTDLDLLVIMDNDACRLDQITEACIALDLKVKGDIMIYTPVVLERFTDAEPKVAAGILLTLGEQAGVLQNFAFRLLEGEGKVLYERPS